MFHAIVYAASVRSERLTLSPKMAVSSDFRQIARAHRQNWNFDARRRRAPLVSYISALILIIYPIFGLLAAVSSSNWPVHAETPRISQAQDR
jgi:hypothetical protein